MNNWIKLIDYQDEYIKRGAIFRIPSVEMNRGNWYREDIVDLMVFDASGTFEGAVYGLICVSGHKAGLINTIFPEESSGNSSIGLSRKWIVDKWNYWVYPDGDVNSVWIRNPSKINSMPKLDG
jgi:hypothetical protein